MQMGKSERERAVEMRRNGETGWTFGWDPYSLKDQFAFLGEQAAMAASLQETKGQSPHGDEMLSIIEPRIEWDAWTLAYIHGRLGMDDTITPALLLDSERAYREAHGISMPARTEASPTFFSEQGATEFAAWLTSRDVWAQAGKAGYFVTYHAPTESMPKPTWTIEFSDLDPR